MKTILEYEDIEAIRELLNSEFGKETCFDYISELGIDTITGLYGVTVFVEPCGDITRYGDSFIEALKWWIMVFSTQPPSVDYITAGNYLMDVYEQNKFTDNPSIIWDGLK